MTDNSISVVTVCRNRQSHILKSCCHTSRLPYHCEHIVLDLGSSPAICSSDLPPDHRIKLFHVPYQGPWWLSHSFNLAMALASSNLLVHCDADCLLTPAFFEQMLEDAKSVKFSVSRLTPVDLKLTNDKSYPSSGIYWVQRDAYWRVNGLNPYLQGWGYEELDLFSRLFRAGFAVCRVPKNGLQNFIHSDHMRVDANGSEMLAALRYKTSHAIKRACQHKNMRISTLMIERGMTSWPSKSDYKEAFEKFSALPDLPAISLLTPSELKGLQRYLFRVWLSASINPDFLGRLLAFVLTPMLPQRWLEWLLVQLGIFVNQNLLDAPQLKT